MDRLKIIFAGIISAFLALVEPLSHVIILLLILFFANILIGLIEDFAVSNGTFKIRKFFRAFSELLIYICIAVLFHHVVCLRQQRGEIKHLYLIFY